MHDDGLDCVGCTDTAPGSFAYADAVLYWVQHGTGGVRTLGSFALSSWSASQGAVAIWVMSVFTMQLGLPHRAVILVGCLMAQPGAPGWGTCWALHAAHWTPRRLHPKLTPRPSLTTC